MMWRTGLAYMNETLVHERVFERKEPGLGAPLRPAIGPNPFAFDRC